MTRKLKDFAITSSLLVACVLLLGGCKLQYAGEDFDLTIKPDGAVELSVFYRDFGSAEETSTLKSRDLKLLKDTANSKKTYDDAMKKGVVLKERKLDIVNYTMNGELKASASSIKKLFDVLEYYDYEKNGGYIYITPKNGLLIRATHGDTCKIDKRNGRLAFVWPDTEKHLVFTAGYRVKAGSFRREFQRQYGDDR